MRGFLVAFIASVLLAGPTLAASPMGQLKDVDGKVYVNRGTGFELVRGDTELFQGDRVMVGEDGSATVNYYLAECDVMLTSSSMTTVPAKAPCKGGSQVSSQTEGLTFSESPVGMAVVGVGVAGFAGLGIAQATDNSERDEDEGRSP